MTTTASVQHVTTSQSIKAQYIRIRALTKYRKSVHHTLFGSPSDQPMALPSALIEGTNT